MSVPDGSDASTDAGASAIQAPADEPEESDSADRDDTDLHSADRAESSDSLGERVVDWASHWQAWGIALFSLSVVGWAVFLQPEASPKGYIPIFAAFAALAVGYVYLEEESQIHFAST
jgi:hypothetical protein